MPVFAINTVEPTDDTQSSAALVADALAGQTGAFEAIMRRNNRRLFRVARGIVGTASEAEDVVQETHLRAFAALDQMTDTNRLPAWLARIAANEALGRLRRRRQAEVLEDEPLAFPARRSDPETAAAQGEIRNLIEDAIDDLPPTFRSVFMLRAIEEFSVAETAECLGVPPDTVKTRFHRAKRDIRRALDRQLVSTMSDAFPFGGARCDRIVMRVLTRLN